MEDQERPQEEGAEPGPETPGEPEAGPAEVGAKPGKEYESLYLKIQKMGVAERIALALKGDKEARAILIKDANKLVQLGVVSSPRVQEAEIIAIAKNRSVHDDVLRRVASRKEWLKHHEVRLGLVQNPRTPLPLALKLVPTLNARDLQALAKSKNVPTAIATLARRAVLSKKAGQ